MRWMTLALALLTSIASADLDLPNIFADHMVIQRDVKVPVWGTAAPNARVEVRFGNVAGGDVAGADGTFMVWLPPQTASATPAVMTVTSGTESIQIRDVLVGEVWLCSGQSNMVWNLRNTLDGERFAREATDSRIRMFTIPNTAEHTPQDDCRGEWKVASPETAGSFSAVAYHFGRELIAKLDVPIGLVNSSWGGSTVEAWVSRDVLETISEAAPFLEAYDQHHAVNAMDIGEFVGSGIDLAGWDTIELPQLVEDAGHDIDGIMWFRRMVEIPAGWVGEDLLLELGAIDDNDVTFVNGTKVGSTNNWQRPRSYRVPAAAVTGREVTIAIRVEDTGGAGGFSGGPEQLRLGRIVPGEAPVSLSGDWHWKLVSPHGSGPTQHRPANLYNGMIHPIRHLAIRGVIWYQGESNAIRPRGEEYIAIFPAMIEQWRDAFDDEDLPFYYVQLPLFTNNEENTVWRYPVVRQAQLETMRLVPNTGMAVTLDLGEANDIHPRNKHDVGDRLARWALVDVYGVDGIVKSGPIVSGATMKGNGEAMVEFEVFGSALTPGVRGLINGFEVDDDNGEFRPVEARVLDDTTVVLGHVEAPSRVRYAWRNNPTDANLKNAEGMPASPFVLSFRTPEEQ